MRTLIAAAALLTALATRAAVAAEAAPGAAPGPDAPLMLPLGGLRTNPDWLVKPSGEDVEREYPPLARLMSLSGSAQISCRAEPSGRVDECTVVAESPVGLGFGAAALRTAAYVTMKPATLNGVAVPAAVTIPIHFTMAAEAVDPAPPAPPVSEEALAAAREIVRGEDFAGRLRAQMRPELEQASARTVVEGNVEAGQAALDALRLALDEAVAEEAERRAHVLAALLTPADLRAALAFTATPAGKALASAKNQSEETAGADFMARLARAARAHLCAKTSCGAAAARAGAVH